MCDTFVVLPQAALAGRTLFAKNTDRDPNEAHEVVVIPSADHPVGSQVKCTYVEIPQVTHTYSVLLAKPFWIWGAEMGANEHGVAIGNEAVFTRIPCRKEPGLIGMDFLRLALERAKTAWDALQVITQLLEKYGQGGNCGYNHPMYYHNSFLIADPKEAWVLETADIHWVAEKVKDVRSISNALTIGNQFDLASTDLVNYAVDHGWCRQREKFHFARDYSDFLYTTFADGKQRQACTASALTSQKGNITIKQMMDLLRHHRQDVSWFKPDRALIGADVCMHASMGPIRGSQSVGSMVSDLGTDLQTHWVTGTSAPCLSIFKPVWLDTGIPDMGPQLTGTFNPESLWWQHEILHRYVIGNYQARSRAVRQVYNDLQNQYLTEWEASTASPESRRNFSEECFRTSRMELSKLIEQVKSDRHPGSTMFYYKQAWNHYNQQAKFPFQID
ncbi:MAG TPA: C69 family dipeptidase [Anaerolineaceae bacterium]